MELKCDTILTNSCTRKPSFKKTQTSFYFHLIKSNTNTQLPANSQDLHVVATVFMINHYKLTSNLQFLLY